MSKPLEEPLYGRCSDATAPALMQWFLDSYAAILPQTNYDIAFMRSLKCISAQVATKTSTAKATFRFTIPPNLTNQTLPGLPRTTHGGVVGMFFDMPTNLTVLACNFPGWEWTGLTRRMDVTYLRQPVEGDVALVDCEVIQIGKRLAVVRGVLKRERDGVMLATCQHDKYLRPMRVLPHEHFRVPPPKL